MELQHIELRNDSRCEQVAVHAIGDRAVDDLLAVYTSVLHSNGPRDRRLRIEHAQVTYLTQTAPPRG